MTRPFQLHIVGIHDESMNEDAYEVLAHITKLSKCKELHLKKSCLTKAKLQGLLYGCRNHGTQVRCAVNSVTVRKLWYDTSYYMRTLAIVQATTNSRIKDVLSFVTIICITIYTYIISAAQTHYHLRHEAGRWIWRANSYLKAVGLQWIGVSTMLSHQEKASRIIAWMPQS